MSEATPRPSRIGAYPIESELGRGGMGIVYLGRDPRLDRPVAIKVLPDAFAADPERLARFEREARLLASLSHPNIAGIFGLEESEGRRFLVLEYVEGETLAQRIARGPLPVDEAVDVCRQIAAALEAAHESGVVHRDLKPGNVKLTPAGAVKVLDFGLARGAGSDAGSDPSLSHSPTMAVSALTGAGVILGTAAYMSPEQARGKVVDRRTDIWSFGCVLYECLAGRPAFEGETVSDLVAQILQGEPDWKALPAALPAHLRALLDRCLTKDAKRRLRDIGEARLLLEGGALPGSTASATFMTLGAEPPARPRGARLAWTLAALFAIASAALGAILVARAPAPAPVERLSLPVPPMPFPFRDVAIVALSPDGTLLATTVGDSAGGTSLWLRPLDAAEGRALPGTEDGIGPFWSPDGRYVAFSTQDRLKRLDLRGGSPEDLCPIASYGRGGSWSPRGVIVFSGGPEGPIYKVPENGGTPEPATTLDSAETGHRYPRFLPDGRRFLFAAMPPHEEQFTIYVGSIDSPRRQRLMEADGTPVYVEPGWLLYLRNGRLVAHRFDAGSCRLIGQPVVLADEPSRSQFLGSPSVAASRGISLAYFDRQTALARLAWLDRPSRVIEHLPVAPGPYESCVVSPDGTMATVVRTTSPTASDLWVLDLRRGSMSRLTRSPGRVDRAVWSPDGTRIAFSSNRTGRWDIYEIRSDGTGAESPIVVSGSLLKYPNGYTPDGRELLFEQIGERSGWDVWKVPLEGDRTPRPLLTTPSDEQYASVSHDGRWLLFSSNESGRPEIYVQGYPVPGRRHMITTTGGSIPRWRSDDREILFLASSSVGYVTVDPDAGFATGTPEVHPFSREITGGDAAPSFARLLGIVRVAGGGDQEALTLVVNWRSELGRR